MLVLTQPIRRMFLFTNFVKLLLNRCDSIYLEAIACISRSSTRPKRCRGCLLREMQANGRLYRRRSEIRFVHRGYTEKVQPPGGLVARPHP
jgi:hypothetical protein